MEAEHPSEAEGIPWRIAWAAGAGSQMFDEGLKGL